MLMLGNIDSTNVSAKEKHYGGKKKEKKKELAWKKGSRSNATHVQLLHTLPKA